MKLIASPASPLGQASLLSYLPFQVCRKRVMVLVKSFIKLGELTKSTPEKYSCLSVPGVINLPLHFSILDIHKQISRVTLSLVCCNTHNTSVCSSYRITIGAS